LYTILINSSDGFEDCWDPFFWLFYKYWEDHSTLIMLNTEKKTFTFNGLNIISSQSNLGIDHHLTWSGCLINALKAIKTPLVLYFQEDYFLEKPVLIDIINEFAKLMLKDNSIKYIGLTNSGNLRSFKEWSKEHSLWEVSKESRYRISTQCALWDRETLISYLRPEENGWMFEIFGTRRSKKRNDLFLTANQDLFNNENQIVFYQPTGIIKGKWLKTIPFLFEKEGLKMDFSKRGFYVERNPFFRKIETFAKLLKNRRLLFNGLRGL